MYRAPEMCDLYSNLEIGPASDVWALGCIAYALCFRKHPFLADSPLQARPPLAPHAWGGSARDQPRGHAVAGHVVTRWHEIA